MACAFLVALYIQFFYKHMSSFKCKHRLTHSQCIQVADSQSGINYEESCLRDKEHVNKSLSYYCYASKEKWPPVSVSALIHTF